MNVIMYDTITLDTVPPNPVAVAGYVGGRWPTYDALVKSFPHAHHLSIAINAFEYAHCLDIESGDAVPSQAPDWVKHYFRGPGLPVLYTSASQIDAVVSTMAKAGYKRSDYLIWSAHYSMKQHICAPNVCGWPQANGTQFWDRALNRNLDISLVPIEFFGPITPSPNTHHYDWYPNTPVVFPEGAGGISHKLTLNERATVTEYDNRLRANPKKGSPSDIRIQYVLRPHIKILRDRIWVIATKLDHEANGKPSWGVSHRGWRWQHLNERLHGPVRLS